ncbi:hypothetical protein POF50_000865 [Streptomyces sp. SL13]|uniref:Uncharacterized protein n=1 Tax=Streptantibioticus silvisoli TaxID=2705255 RepID=A0AA90K749_9ACTN|nr:hypothetical protein [Streptantibioticus silvisoli]MDI5967917.1 hypothetical protein [Streptantibioticus silvisoli]
MSAVTAADAPAAARAGQPDPVRVDAELGRVLDDMGAGEVAVLRRAGGRRLRSQAVADHRPHAVDPQGRLCGAAAGDAVVGAARHLAAGVE